MGRCSIGVVFGHVGACAVAVMFTGPHGSDDPLSAVYAGITFQQPIMFAVCLDIGGPYAGAIVGSMNTAAQVGSLISAVAFGYLVDRYGSYDLPSSRWRCCSRWRTPMAQGGSAKPSARRRCVSNVPDEAA